MRVVIVTESFPPDVNGVAHCAQQTARHIAARGHEPLVVAPAAGRAARVVARAPQPPLGRAPEPPAPQKHAA
ncbi:glycosyltransferase family 1 protein, partial [Streptomyces pristinaespiralis]